MYNWIWENRCKCKIDKKVKKSALVRISWATNNESYTPGRHFKMKITLPSNLSWQAFQTKIEGYEMFSKHFTSKNSC